MLRIYPTKDTQDFKISLKDTQDLKFEVYHLVDWKIPCHKDVYLTPNCVVNIIPFRSQLEFSYNCISGFQNTHDQRVHMARTVLVMKKKVLGELALYRHILRLLVKTSVERA